jgi:hypothetical protein
MAGELGDGIVGLYVASIWRSACLVFVLGTVGFPKVFLNASSAVRFEWYMNECRCRSTLSADDEKWLAVGTTRNEQIHARLNATRSVPHCTNIDRNSRLELLTQQI